MNAARVMPFALSAALLAACGGGGSAPPAVIPKSIATSPPTGTPMVVANLTLHYPPNFQRAAFAPTTTVSARRKLAYVNPNGLNIDVFVDGVDETAGQTTTAGDGGAQTFPLSINSTLGHAIVAVETEGGLNGTIVSIGETDIGGRMYAPGDAPVIGLTMQMNVQYIGVMTSPTNANGDALIGSPFNSSFAIACASGASFTLYPFAADITGGFIAGTGAGTVIPNLASSTNLPGTSPSDTTSASTSGVNTGYVLTYYDTTTGGIQLNLSASNPAELIFNNIYNFYYNYPDPVALMYPGIYALYQSGTLPIANINLISTVTTSISVPPSCPY